MKTKLLTLLLLMSSTVSFSQTPWETNGNIIGVTDWLGSQNNQALSLRTNNAERMRLYQSQTSTINGFTVDQTGYLLLSREPVLFNTLGPFSMLHLGGVQGSMELSFRDWMKDGMTITGNGDAMYMGLRAMPDVPDETETVIAWACQDGTTGSGEVDNIRIQVNSVGQLENITGGIQYYPRRQA